MSNNQSYSGDVDAVESQKGIASPMLTVAEAEVLLKARIPIFPSEKVSLETAGGAVLQQKVVAERDQPPFDRVTMDGIAIAFPSWQAGNRTFNVCGTQAAGQVAGQLKRSNDCVEIMTGAMLPSGADTVVPVERLRVSDGTAVIEDDYQVEERQFVHHRGSDRVLGAVLLEPGVPIRGPEMALLTVAGLSEVVVSRSPRIAMISTGDELIDVGQPIADFQVRSCNDRAIETTLQRRNLNRVTRARVPDDLEILERRISQLHDQNDVLILSGGVSMGKFDYIPRIMEALEVELVLYKVSQRPGLPLWFGISRDRKPIFALPGNPVSSLVCLVRHVIPALEHALGLMAPDPEWVVLKEPVEFAPELTYFVPALIESDTTGVLRATARPTNTSGDFVSLAGTDGFIELEREQSKFPPGHVARLYRW